MQQSEAFQGAAGRPTYSFQIVSILEPTLTIPTILALPMALQIHVLCGIDSRGESSSASLTFHSRSPMIGSVHVLFA